MNVLLTILIELAAGWIAQRALSVGLRLARRTWAEHGFHVVSKARLRQFKSREIGLAQKIETLEIEVTRMELSRDELQQALAALVSMSPTARPMHTDLSFGMRR